MSRWLPGVGMIAMLLVSCAAPATPSATIALATPTPFGTVVVQTLPPELSIATETPLPPPRQCLFPYDLNDGAGIKEVGVYRVNWAGTPLVVTTRGGDITLSLPVSSPHGLRTLVVVHNGDLPAELNLSDRFIPGAVLLVLPAQGVQEMRASDGRYLVQRLFDPLADVRGISPEIDILSVERLFGAQDDFVLRVTLASADDGQTIFTFQSIEALLGNERYAARRYADGRALNLFYDANGQPTDYTGTVIVQGPTVTWTLSSGSDLPFGAQTGTSAANGDRTPFYPIDLLEQLWQAARRNCGL